MPNLSRQGLDNEDDEVTPEQRLELARLMRMVDGASERQDRLVAEVLVSVPDDWLVLDAPECSVDFVRDDHWNQVIVAIQEARADTAKN